MNIIALDLGSTTGYAFGPHDSIPMIGSRTWATDKELRTMRQTRGDRRGDLRIIRFFDWLTYTHKQCKFDAVCFEDVQFSSSTAQTQLWSSFRACVWLAFPRTLVEAVPVGSLKKFASGNGSADKSTMGTALKQKHPELWREDLDDNAWDAAFLWCWGKENLSRCLTQ